MVSLMPTSTHPPKQRRHSGGDQARGLRELVARRMASTEMVHRDSHDGPARRCHTIAVTGGKGGVGRSVIALNLAISLAQRGGSVGLLDASPDFGNIELLCGLNGYWNLNHVLQGSRQLDDVLLTGPAGIHILSGASCLTDSASSPDSVADCLNASLCSFEKQLDWLVVDASGGAAESTRDFALAADDTLIVATPELTAVAEAYSSVKSMALSSRSRLGLLVNQADSADQAHRILDRLQQAAHSFLQVDLHRRGFISRDGAVAASVNDRVPFVIQAPDSPAAIELVKLALRWTRPHRSDGTTSFFSRLLNRENGA